jgi:hypothetical protein
MSNRHGERSDANNTSAVQGEVMAPLPTLADGDVSPLALDTSGRLIVSPGVLGAAVSPYDSAGVVASLVVKASAGVLHSIFVYNNAAATRYIQLFNLAALPANGVVPNFIPIEVPAGSNGSVEFAKGWVASAGIVLVSSTTILTKTITVAADVWFSGEYE